MLSLIACLLGLGLMVLPGLLVSKYLIVEDKAGRLAIGIVLSFCMLILGGLLIAFTGRLDKIHWLGLIAVLIFVGSLVSGGLTRASRELGPSLRWPSRHAIVPTCCCLTALGLSVLAYRKAVTDEATVVEFPVIEMWMLESRLGQTMKIGLQNRVPAETSLAIEISWNDMIIEKWPAVSLAPGETLVRETVLPSYKGSGKILARLFRDADREKVINEVSLSLVR